MSHQNIEEVAVKYLADWIQLMKVVNHRSTNRAKESDLIDFIFEEFIKNTSPVVQKFWNIFLKIKGHNAKAFVQQSNIEFLGQANKRRIQIKLAPVDITREADIRTFGSSLEISMIPQQSINKILRELLDRMCISVFIKSPVYLLW
jgi:ribosomal protein L6P/L9E